MNHLVTKSTQWTSGLSKQLLTSTSTSIGLPTTTSSIFQNTSIRWSPRTVNFKILNEQELIQRAKQKKYTETRNTIQKLCKREPAILVQHDSFQHPFKMQPIPDPTASNYDEIPQLKTQEERLKEAMSTTLNPPPFLETSFPSDHYHSAASNETSTDPSSSSSTSLPTCFAIFDLNGTQHKVVEGDLIMHDRISDVEVGSTIRLTNVLLLASRDRTIIGRPTVESAFVDAQIEEHTETKKLLVFHKKRKKNYRRMKGFRHQVTTLRILKINFPEEDGKSIINTLDALKIYHAPTMLIKTANPEDNVKV